MNAYHEINKLVKSAQSVTGYVDPAFQKTMSRIGASHANPWTVDDTKKWNEESGDPLRNAKSDPGYFNILVGGASEAGKGYITGKARMPWRSLINGDNYKLFRHNQESDIRKAIEEAKALGKKVRVWGHSWGGSRVGGMAKDYPDIPFYSIDPVSITGRPKKTPGNLTILYPDGEHPTQKDRFTEHWAPIIGGRWPFIPGEGKRIPYKGGHSAGVPEAISKIVYDKWLEREAPTVENANRMSGGESLPVAKSWRDVLGKYTA